MVKIKTRDFGEIEVSEDDLLTFPAGVFAFEEVRHFALISPLGEDVYPKWLQSTDDIAPCFIVFDPSIIDESYEITLNVYEENLIKYHGDDSIRLLAIATVPDNYRETTVNMKSPIVINVDARLAAQVILPQNYVFKLPIYTDEPDAKAGDE